MIRHAFYKMAWLTRNKSLQNASVCYKNAPVMEQWKCTQGWTFDFNWYFSSQKTAIPPDAKKGGILNPNGKSALTNKFLFVYCCAVFPKAFFYTCPFPIGKSYHWTIGPWPSLQGAFSVQKDHRIARFEEFLLTCDTRCFSMFFFNYTTGTQQESAQHAQFLHLHLFHTHIFCPLVVDQSGSRVDLMESRLALRKSAGETVVTSSDMGETSSICRWKWLGFPDSSATLTDVLRANK